jgi:hypothetical protein
MAADPDCRVAACYTMVPPNHSLNRTANGMALWPRGAVVHHAPRGQGAMPPWAG